MDPLERRAAILEVLCRSRHETTANLAAQFGVSERTIRNDILVLSCSYPIQTVRGRYGGGVVLADWFRRESKSLSPKQETLLKQLALTLTGEDLAVMNSILTQFSLCKKY